MSAFVLAVLVTVAGVVISGLWFGVLRRRKVETELGVQALANMKWRDCIAVVLEALHRDGYQRSAVSEVPAGGATEVMLTREGQDVLLDYKHGTAYHLTDSNVREFVNDVSLNGAREGILVTLGSAGVGARLVAATHAVQIIDGPTLWPKVRNYLPPLLLEGVRRQAAAQIRTGLWTGALASLFAGGAAWFLIGDRFADAGPTVADAEVAALGIPAMQSVRAPGSDAAMLARINATAQALEEVKKLTPEQLGRRRADAARLISGLPRVGVAAWAAPRTLLVNLSQAADDAKDDRLLDEACRVLVQNEEMRFTRVQLESPAASNRRVRWRLCN